MPNSRFMFCTAWPEAPFTRLSITAIGGGKERRGGGWQRGSGAGAAGGSGKLGRRNVGPLTTKPKRAMQVLLPQMQAASSQQVHRFGGAGMLTSEHDGTTRDAVLKHTDQAVVAATHVVRLPV